jgi:hypothetical protein
MKMRTINRETLARLASDPKLKPKDIAKGCGFGRAFFFMTLGQNPALTEIYKTGRERAGFPAFDLPALRKQKHGPLDEVELSIIGAIGNGRRTMDAIRAAVINPQTVAAKLYNLENQKHEIWSVEVGHPPRTHYFLRSEEAAQQTANSKQPGNEVSTTSR